MVDRNFENMWMQQTVGSRYPQKQDKEVSKRETTSQMISKQWDTSQRRQVNLMVQTILKQVQLENLGVGSCHQLITKLFC